MASDDCCKTGTLHSGHSVGKEAKLEGLDVYVVEPSAPTDKAVLFLHDAFGWQLPNNRLLADHYAKEANVRVFLPDLFDGKPVPEAVLADPEQRAKFDWGSFLKANGRDAKWPVILSFAKALKEKHGVTKLAAIGFCWGGWGAILLTATDLIEASAVAHPSLLNVPADIENIAKPTLFLCAETDAIFPDAARKQSEEILEKKKPLYSKFKVYPGTTHGFAVRGDPNNKPESEAAHDAKHEAVEFFKSFL